MPLIVNTLQGLFELRAAIWRCFPQLSLSPVRLEQPAGKDLVLESGSLLTVRSETGKSGMMILTLPAEGRSKASRPSLEFQRYGSDYFPTKIWRGGAQDGRAMPVSNRQRELTRRATFKRTEQVALQMGSNHVHDVKQLCRGPQVNSTSPAALFMLLE